MDPPANCIRQQTACRQDTGASEHLMRVFPQVAVQLLSQTLDATMAWDYGKCPSEVLVIRLAQLHQNMCN